LQLAHHLWYKYIPTWPALSQHIAAILPKYTARPTSTGKSNGCATAPLLAVFQAHCPPNPTEKETDYFCSWTTAPCALRGIQPPLFPTVPSFQSSMVNHYSPRREPTTVLRLETARSGQPSIPHPIIPSSLSKIASSARDVVVILTAVKFCPLADEGPASQTTTFAVSDV
jgi:hypothetical protein